MQHILKLAHQEAATDRGWSLVPSIALFLDFLKPWVICTAEKIGHFNKMLTYYELYWQCRLLNENFWSRFYRAMHDAMHPRY